jgi:hypothetical protein
MPAYTSVLQKPLETIFWEDDNFMEELLQVVRLFRPFSAAITEFISEHGYQGDTSDIDAKVAFIRAAFAKADMDAPREVREWFTLQQPIKRDTVFQICFAFGLDGGETDEFFRRIFTRERSFNCHQMPEAIYYFCLNNGLTWTDAMDIQSSVSLSGKEKTNGDIVYTSSIIAELNNLQDKDDLIHWLNDNIDKFAGSNVTAYETIRRLWEEVSGPDGLLIQERKSLPSIHDDAATGEKSKLRSNVSGVRSYDAYLAILQLDKKEVKRLATDRSIKPILERLHDNAQDSFPDRQGIELILRGEIVSYERVRKWLVLLTFYTYWVRKALSKGNYEADSGDADRCITSMNQHLINSGYPELYVGNPYDWIFFYAAKCEEPLYVFRYIWNELLTGVLEKHQ